ncbi:hypothetical protein ACE4V3_00940 [Borrelia recurrentis]|uniref:Uncharacterized conserved protein n=1 Tax=Borrelia recurrentis (strain A1) TaxID=412418 RepID=B5RQ07_BORRA|nr:hypothetical protein [Borrelia recurrentis]ACH94891.1 uncharacterized conserved protein [Borrelia recurrentis A1]
MYFRSNDYSYTVIQSKNSYVQKSTFGISFVILNRGTKIFREDLFEFLSNFDFIREIISIEKQSNRTSLQFISENYDKLKFILLSGDLNSGEKVNLAMKESICSFVFVLQSDMYLLNPFWIPNIFDEIVKKNVLLVGGEFFDKDEEVVPSIFLPTIDKYQRLKVILINSERDYEKTLITMDYCGLYSKEKFIQLGGFDKRIKNEYFQRLDFGLRAIYFGESIYIYRKLRIQYTALNIPEDLTKNKSFLIFLLKNYVPIFIGNGVKFSFLRFIRLCLRYGVNPFRFGREFKEIKYETIKNSLRFKGDLKSAIELWENNIID